jgi:multidrug efflux pump
MTLPQLSIRRPVLATVMNVIIVLVGLICYDRLSVRQTPKIDTPVVTVATGYPGANAAVVESQITKPIEDAIAGIEGVDFITSTSRAESSQITVVFHLDRDPEDAASDVRDRVNQAREVLPQDARDPIVQKQEADAQPIIWLAFSSDRHTQLEVADYAQRYVKDRLQALPGVAQARVFAAQYAMRVWLEPDRMAAYRITPEDVENALRRQNVEIPAGRIESQAREFTVLAETDLATPAQFQDVILRDNDGYLVRLGDVARVELGPSDERSIGRFNGRPAVPLGVVKQATANPLDISAAIRAALPNITAQMPEGMRVDVGYDSTMFIEASIDSVYETIGEAVLLVVLVIFLFLRSFRATLIPLVTIPVSLVGACAIMYALGFTLNTLTLLSFVLAIGLVVDDAIVVLENIHRHIENGMKPFDAAIKGSKEIAFAVVAMTLTLAAVYLPIAFQGGSTGKLFTEFALTLAGAVIVSGFVALTLSPMMCSKLLRHEERPGRFYLLGERALAAIVAGYRRSLGWALRSRKAIMAAWAVIAFGLLPALFLMLPRELAPKEDPGFVLTFGMGPEGSTLEYMDKYARQIEAIYETIPEVDRYFLFVGWPQITNTISFPGLKDWSERERSATEIQMELFGRFMGIPGIMAFPNVPAPLGGDFFGGDLQFVVLTTESYDELNRITSALVDEARNNPAIQNPRSNLEMNKPELRITVNRDKAGTVGADVSTVGRTLETLMGGRQVTRFKKGSEQYDVLLQVERTQRSTPEALTGVYVRGRDGQIVQLANLLDVEESVAPRELNHFNKLRAATISATLAPGYSLGEAIQFMETKLRNVAQGKATYELSGQARTFREAASATWFLLALAIGFIYLVLAAQFESFVDPLVILLSVPLAFFGALLALWLSGVASPIALLTGTKAVGGTWNLYSQIGIVTLIGLIAKHGILIVEFANQMVAQGLDKLEAVRESATLRLRPILMTTGAMVLGAVPLAIASGAGAEGRQEIGWVIVGGMTIGTVFTLFVVPVIYSLLSRRKPGTVVAPADDAAASEPAPAHG